MPRLCSRMWQNRDDMNHARPKKRNLHQPLARERPDLVAEWHRTKNLPLTPWDVTAGMETRVWWKCRKGPDHVWQARVIGRAYAGNGCPFCANREVSRKSSLAVLAPKIAREWHPTKNGTVKPTDVVPGSAKRVWWRCHVGHEWQTSLVQRTRIGTGCPYCVGYRVTPERTLAALFPAVAKTWHPKKNGRLKPSDVSAGSAKKVWWLCKRGHEWEASLNSRTGRGTGCPMCAGHQVTPETSLAAVDPAIAATWHPTRNGRLRPKDVMPNSRRDVWWRCPKGSDHVWKISICARRTSPNCPFCTNHRLSRTNALSTVYKAIAREWHPTKNGALQPSGITHNSCKIAWWRCKWGHEWQAGIGYRTSRGVGCPGCRFDGQLQRRRETGKLRPVDRALLAVTRTAGR
jgi:uncharacterized protein YndB with AHSA1/START domain